MLGFAALGTEARMTVVVRTEHGAAEIRALAKAAVTPEQARRLLAIALVLEGTEPRRSGAAARCDGSANPAVDRGAIDGCTVSTPPGRWVWSTARRRAGNGGWARATAGTGSLPGERPRVGSGRGGPLASGRSLRPVSCADIPPGDRPEADGRAAFRRQLSGARHGQAGPGARLQPDLGPAAAPQIRSRGAGRVQQKLADRIAATVADKAQGRRLELWFQML